MTDWLRGHGVTAAVMEGTGIYWKAPFEALEEAGIRADLLHAQHVLQIRGKKTDTNDSLWLARISQFGLALPSYVRRVCSGSCAIDPLSSPARFQTQSGSQSRPQDARIMTVFGSATSCRTCPASTGGGVLDGLIAERSTRCILAGLGGGA